MLVVVTLQRRKELAVLRRIGATTRQLVAAATWQAGGLTLIGAFLGIVAQISTVATVSKALTGSLVPDVPWPSVAAILGLVTLLTGLAIIAPTTSGTPACKPDRSSGARRCCPAPRCHWAC
jgi:ABC-type antimicrobial peptide transport system permease subunit